MSNDSREVREQLARIEALLKQVRIGVILLTIILLPIFGPFALAMYAKLTEWVGGTTTPALLFPLAVIVTFVLVLLLKLKPEP